MAWRDRLVDASFRGVTFKVEDESAGVGRRVETHEYPNRDKPYTEDLGKFSMEGMPDFVQNGVIEDATSMLGFVSDKIKMLDSAVSDAARLLQGDISVLLPPPSSGKNFVGQLQTVWRTGNRLSGNASDLYTMIKNFSGITLGCDLAPRGVWKTDSVSTRNRTQQSNNVASASRTTAISEAAYAVTNLPARAEIGGIDPGKKCQTVDVSLIAGEQKTGIEHLEPYGFTSHATEGAEAVLLFPDADRSHAIAITVADRRYRLKGLAGGEVAVYDDQGQSVTLMRAGIVVNGGGKPIVFTNAPKARFEMDIEATGQINDLCDSNGQTMAAMRTAYNGHRHHENGQGSNTNTPDTPMGA